VQHRDSRGVPSREEERELIRRAQGGDTEARNELIIAFRPFVRYLAKRYCHHPGDLPDFASEGIFGLAHAISKFDLAGPNRLATYARGWIYNRMQLYAESLPLSRVPRNLSRERRYYESEDWREGATRKEIAKVLAARAAMQSPLSLSFDDDEAKSRPLDVADPRQSDPIVALEEAEGIESLYYHIESLDVRDRDVICRRFGIAGRECETLQSVARAIGVTKERARQIESRALSRLHYAMEHGVTLSGQRNSYMANRLHLRAKSPA
jgi:RNA polymerase sigma factor (sigma-70 family)